MRRSGWACAHLAFLLLVLWQVHPPLRGIKQSQIVPKPSTERTQQLRGRPSNSCGQPCTSHNDVQHRQTLIALRIRFHGEPGIRAWPFFANGFIKVVAPIHRVEYIVVGAEAAD